MWRSGDAAGFGGAQMDSAWPFLEPVPSDSFGRSSKLRPSGSFSREWRQGGVPKLGVGSLKRWSSPRTWGSIFYC